MNDRLYKIRKELNLSRAAFGEKLGVSGDVINNLERGRVDMKEYMVKLTCAVFSINETWLRTGDGEMFAAASDGLIDQLSREYHLDEAGQRLLFSFLSLNAEKRKIVLDYVKHTIDLLNSGVLQAFVQDDSSRE